MTSAGVHLRKTDFTTDFKPSEQNRSVKNCAFLKTDAVGRILLESKLASIMDRTFFVVSCFSTLLPPELLLLLRCVVCMLHVFLCTTEYNSGAVNVVVGVVVVAVVKLWLNSPVYCCR